MKEIKKLGRAWVYVVNPMGYDPYDSYVTSFMVNSDLHDPIKLARDILSAFEGNQAVRDEFNQRVQEASELPNEGPYALTPEFKPELDMSNLI
jgi:hypothetical protein